VVFGRPLHEARDGILEPKMIADFSPSMFAGLLFTAVVLVIWGLIIIKNPKL
jgi:hypothetical protein